jgi:hypothetical protein
VKGNPWRDDDDDLDSISGTGPPSVTLLGHTNSRSSIVVLRVLSSHPNGMFYLVTWQKNLYHRQENSLKLVPTGKAKSASVQDTSNSLGLHDTFRHGPRSLAAEVRTESGLRDRLENVSYY